MQPQKTFSEIKLSFLIFRYKLTSLNVDTGRKIYINDKSRCIPIDLKWDIAGNCVRGVSCRGTKKWTNQTTERVTAQYEKTAKKSSLLLSNCLPCGCIFKVAKMQVFPCCSTKYSIEGNTVDEYETSFKFRKTRYFPKMEQVEILIINFTVAIAKLILCVKFLTFNSRNKQFM